MEHVHEYTGPVTLTMCGRELPATADLQAWRYEPHAVTEDGQVVHSLAPETAPRWTGTITITPGDGPPVELPVDGALTLRLGDRQATAAVEAIEWTLGEQLVLAVIGTGGAPF